MQIDDPGYSYWLTLVGDQGSGDMRPIQALRFHQPGVRAGFTLPEVLRACLHRARYYSGKFGPVLTEHESNLFGSAAINIAAAVHALESLAADRAGTAITVEAAVDHDADPCRYCGYLACHDACEPDDKAAA